MFQFRCGRDNSSEGLLSYVVTSIPVAVVVHVPGAQGRKLGVGAKILGGLLEVGVLGRSYWVPEV